MHALARKHTEVILKTLSAAGLLYVFNYVYVYTYTCIYTCTLTHARARTHTYRSSTE